MMRRWVDEQRTADARELLVPTLCVGTRVPTLCVVPSSGSNRHSPQPINSAGSCRDAERRPGRFHAERGNEGRVPNRVYPRRLWFTWLAFGVLALLSMTAPNLAFAVDADDEEDSQPGLEAQYTAGDRSIDRIDRDVQFVWGAHSPDARLPAGPFSARWTGKLLIRTEGRHAFHVYLQGEATVTLNGKPVVNGRRDTPDWVEGEAVAVEFGEQKIDVKYKKTGDKALLRLFWSSESFPTEPIPPQLFFHDAAHPELDLIERGRDLYGAHCCQACHRREHDGLAEPAPALNQTGTSLDRRWLIDWLLEPHQQTPRARMPGFSFTREEAAAVAAFLLQQPAGQPAAIVPDNADANFSVRQGEILFRSIGCLVCHTRGAEESAADKSNGVPPPFPPEVLKLGQVPALQIGDLTNVGRKRTAGWLNQWLKEPERLKPDHRMPVFKLTDDERRSLALFLAGPGNEKEKPRTPGAARDEGLIAEGKKLIETARCAACHRIGELRSVTSSIPTLERPVKDWSNACSEASADPKHIRPVFTLTVEDRNAIRAFVESRRGPLSPVNPFDNGRSLLRQKGCINCHERDGGRGIGTVAGAMARLDPDLAGQSEALVPPDLSAVGDKLRDEPLAAAIAGKQKTQRLPWLRVRMPRFEHTPAEAEALLAFLIGHDRIPEGAPQGPYPGAPAGPRKINQQAEFRQAGQVLAGTRGFSCTACHKIASHEPRNAALATRGSDLYLLGERMRPEFFTRWTRSPLRIIPGMEMPSYERPIAGILEGRLDRQLAALWEALNDKSAPPKIDTSTIEQLLTVAAGEPAKIIRDVFNVGDPLAPKFVPRAFAVGFDNSVNIVFDLDAMSLRGWWEGNFSRQRAAGKSWYWEPVPEVAIAGPGEAADIALRIAGNPDAPVVSARREAARIGRLNRYDFTPPGLVDGRKASGCGVRLEYVLSFDLPNGPVDVAIADRYFPARHIDGPQGEACVRYVEAANVPPGYDVVLHLPPKVQSRTQYNALFVDTKRRTAVGSMSYGSFRAVRSAPAPPEIAVPTPAPHVEPVTSVPGYDGVRLPMPASIMPTAITWMADGTLAFCSLKGEVFLAKDTDGDGIEDKLSVFEEGLAAPYGLIADGNDLLVAHKPELLRLRDTDGDGRAEVREVVADGWGYTEDYHDWTTGILRDSKGNLYVGTGSDYAKTGRDRENGKWRGKVLRIDPQGNVTPLGHGFRYPTGLAITPDDQVFVSDNQGVQNTFNEINHLVEGAAYGVPSLYEEKPDTPVTLPAIQVPHPWTRSVNGIFFLPPSGSPAPFAGHGIGCEYDNRFLVRFTLQRVGNTYQGAVYPFSMPTPANSRAGFIGTLCGAVSPRGDLYIGSIQDSGWLGGTNVGDIVRMRPNGKLPVGIREIRAGAEDRFLLSFTAPIDKTSAARGENYDISGYTRTWQGTYATPDSGRHKLEIHSVEVAADGLSVVVHTSRQQAGHVYEINCGKIGPAGQATLWPSAGHYTLNQVPKDER